MSKATKIPSQRLKISIEIEGLPQLERDHATDSFCVYHAIDEKGVQIKDPNEEVDCTTEIQYDMLDPHFIRGIEVNYRFEKHQRYRVNVYHAKNDK